MGASIDGAGGDMTDVDGQGVTLGDVHQDGGGMLKNYLRGTRMQIMGLVWPARMELMSAMMNVLNK